VPIAAVAMAQCARRVDDFDRMSTAFEAGDVLGQPIRLVRVVDDDRAVGARESRPVPDAEVRSDEHERAAARKPERHFANALDRHLGKCRRRRKFRPDPDVGMPAQEAPRIDGAQVASARGIPQRIHQMHACCSAVRHFHRVASTAANHAVEHRLILA